MTDKITIKMVSPKGHDLLTLTRDNALDEVKALTGAGKWLFIDGNIVENPAQLTVDDLVRADTLTMTNQLVGGV